MLSKMNPTQSTLLCSGAFGFINLGQELQRLSSRSMEAFNVTVGLMQQSYYAPWPLLPHLLYLGPQMAILGENDKPSKLRDKLT